MMITLYKVGPYGDINYYTVHDRQKHLFGKYSFTVVYGKNLQIGRESFYSFDSRKEMDKNLRKKFNGRIENGYTVLYAYPKPSTYINLYEEQKQKHA